MGNPPIRLRQMPKIQYNTWQWGAIKYILSSYLPEKIPWFLFQGRLRFACGKGAGRFLLVSSPGYVVWIDLSVNHPEALNNTASSVTEWVFNRQCPIDSYLCSLTVTLDMRHLLDRESVNHVIRICVTSVVRIFSKRCPDLVQR